MSKAKNVYRFVEQVLDSVLSLGVAAMRLPHAFYTFPIIVQKPVIIFGNGPSANDGIEDIIPFRDRLLVACVNDFHKKSVFHQLKPDFYFICDPMYWIPETYHIYGEPLQAKLKNVNWPMDIFIPFSGYKRFSKVSSSNSYVSTYYFNTTIATGFTMLKHIFYKLGLGMPCPQNVIVAALFLLMKAGARNIYISGVEHLWHESISLSKDNKLYVAHKNGSYNSEKMVPFYKIEGGELFTVPEIFLAWATVHGSYHELQSWASHIGVRIENVTPNTFIDAFSRGTVVKMLEEVNRISHSELLKIKS